MTLGIQFAAQYVDEASVIHAVRLAGIDPLRTFENVNACCSSDREVFMFCVRGNVDGSEIQQPSRVGECAYLAGAG